METENPNIIRMYLGQGGKAGVWVTTLGTSVQKTMTQSQWETALRIRLFMGAKEAEIDPETPDQECVLCHHLIPGDEIVDLSHLQKCTAINYCSIQTHDKVVNCLHELTKQLHHNIKEPRGIDLNSGKKPDLHLTHKKDNNQLAIDVQITNANQGKLNTITMLTRGHQASKAARAKINKHDPYCSESNIEFLPAIFETSGYIYEPFQDMLTNWYHQISEQSGRTQTSIANYWQSRISIEVQKGVADEINARKKEYIRIIKKNNRSNGASVNILPVALDFQTQEEQDEGSNYDSIGLVRQDSHGD